MKKPKPLTEKQMQELLDTEVAAHPSFAVRSLHEIADQLAEHEDNVGLYLAEDLRETLTEARWKIEEVRDAILRI